MKWINSDEQRVHMEKESDTINHCLRHLLSDSKNNEFASPCHKGSRRHTHERVCTQCLEVFSLIFILSLSNMMIKNISGHACFRCFSWNSKVNQVRSKTKEGAKAEVCLKLYHLNEFFPRIRTSRMIEQMIISKKSVEEYRTHQIRSFASEIDRKDILVNLQPNEALIVLDFSLKIIPTRSVWVNSPARHKIIQKL